MGIPAIIKNQAGQDPVPISLFDSNGDTVLTPTIAAGDIQISLDFGAFNNPATLPSEDPVGSGLVKIPLAQAETNADWIIVRAIDQAGAEWQDVWLFIRTDTQTIGSLIGAAPGCIQYTYTVTNTVTGLGEPGVTVWVTTDLAGTNTIWSGTTDAFGVARDSENGLPCLDAGTYYFWKHKVGFIDNQDPDTEVVS